MATLNGNDVYLSLDGVDVSAYWTGEIGRNVVNDVVETTAGAGQEWKERQAGLFDYTTTFDLVYDVASKGDYLAKLKPGTVQAMVYGPESNVAGKPKDDLSVIITGVTGPNPTINKDTVMWSVSVSGASTPTALIEDGDTF